MGAGLCSGVACETDCTAAPFDPLSLQGIQRVYDDIGDICLDVPNAYTTLGQIVSKGEKAAFVPKHLAADVPQRCVRGGVVGV